MTIQLLAFYFFAFFAVLGALLVITLRNPVHAVLSLVLTFFSVACIWMLMQAEFLALVLIVVYVGAVMVLFLFVVMMLDINIDRLREGFWNYLPLAGLVATMLALEMAIVLGSRSFGLNIIPAPIPHPAGYSNTKELGSLLYTDYVYPFELAAVILLVAIVAAITLTMRRRKNSKYQNPAEQVKVKREDRVRMVDMASEQPSSTKS